MSPRDEFAVFRSRLRLGAIRLPITVVGGLLVLQSSNELDAAKLAYLAVALLTLGLAVSNLVVGAGRQLRGQYTTLLVVDTAFAALLALSYLVSLANGTAAIDWFRDVVSYGLLAAVPVFAIDAAVAAPRWLLALSVVILGALGSLSTAVAWIERRGIADLPIDRLLWPAGHLAIALYAFAIAAAITRKPAMTRKPVVGWICTAGTVLALSFATGSRSSVVMLVVPVVLVVVSRRRGLARLLGIAGAHLVVAVVVFGALELALNLPTGYDAGPPPESSIVGSPLAGAPEDRPSPSSDSTGALERLQTIDGLANDQSLQERVAQYRAAWKLVLHSPLIGVGPGHPIRWVDVSGYLREDFTADTPLVLPAKFGLVGAALVVALLMLLGLLAVDLGRRTGWAAEPLGLLGFGAFAVAIIPFGMPIEDKSFSFALALLIALAVSRGAAAALDSPSKAPASRS